MRINKKLLYNHYDGPITINTYNCNMFFGNPYQFSCYFVTAININRINSFIFSKFKGDHIDSINFTKVTKIYLICG